MVQFFNKRRLKIAEQIIIVSFFAVFVPIVISGIIINNINQHSHRAQLREAAIMVANIVSEEVDVFQKSVNNELSQTITAIEYYGQPEKNYEYLHKILGQSNFYKELAIIPAQSLITYQTKYNFNNDSIIYKKEMSNGNYLIAVLDTNYLRENIFKTLNEDKRQVYVISNKNNQLIASINFEKDVFQNSIDQLPPKLEEDKVVVYGKIKNQPLVYIKKSSPDVTILVNTTENLTKDIIDFNRDKIILSILISMIAIFFIVGIYTSYLYVNIRQLFKAILVISKGNYGRRIRLLTNIFTPFEIVFLANEFNRMISQIHKSYIQLNKKNKELKQLNEFRSNILDTVSHELRTPLTSIQGYVSRLLRQDIVIDDETKQKSLKVIKQQSERLSRLIEDILVIPDLDGGKLNFEIKPVSISSVMENSLLLVKNNAGKEIINNFNMEDKNVLGDNDRLEQVFVNLIENAIKYGKNDTPITIDYELKENKLLVSIKNDYDVIPREKLKTLFNKFTRIDDSTTRTTRGTGLGLYIVKGLVESMDGEIRLYSTEECGFCVKVYLPLEIKEEVYE